MFARGIYCWKYTVFTPNFACITTWYRPKPFISGAIKNKVKKGALQFCACSNLRLLSFNDPEYRPLLACFNIETPSIFEPLVPMRLGVTGCWMVNVSRISVDVHVVPTNARTNYVFVRSFFTRVVIILLVPPSPFDSYSYEIFLCLLLFHVHVYSCTCACTVREIHVNGVFSCDVACTNWRTATILVYSTICCECYCASML